MYSPSIVKSRPPEEVVTVNEPDDVAVPPGVTTEIGPVVAPLGTEVEIWLATVIENVAAVTLNLTLVAPVKLVPVSVTLVPTCPLVGETAVIVGAATLTVKSLADVAVPCGVTIEIFPVTAALGTVNVVAATPPIETEVAPFKFVPVTEMEVPTAPLVGLKLVMVGVFVVCGGVVLVAPPPHPVTNVASASKMAQTETSYPRGRNLLASRLQARSPNNMAPIPSRRPRQEPRGSPSCTQFFNVQHDTVRCLVG